MESSLLNISITSLPSSVSIESHSILNEIISCINTKKPENIYNLIQELKNLNTPAQILLKLGHLLYNTKNYTLAESIYKCILPVLSGPLHREGLFGLGQVCFDSKKFQECHMTFSVINEFYQDFEYIDLVIVKLAHISAMLNDFQSAIVYIKKILESKNSGDGIIIEALVLLAHIRLKQGKTNESLKYCKKAMSVGKNFRALSCFMVLVLDKNPELVDHISKILLRKDRKSGEWSDICFLRALSHIKLDQLDRAEVLLKEQVSAFSNNYFYSEFLGIVYLKKGEIHKALQMFHKVKSIRPCDPVNLNNLAFCFKHYGGKQEALRILSAIDPSENQIGKLKLLKPVEPELEILAFPTNE